MGAFSEICTLDERYFDRFFDNACALTNVDIFHRPLRESEAEFNKGIENVIKQDLAEKALKQKRANKLTTNGGEKHLKWTPPSHQPKSSSFVMKSK